MALGILVRFCHTGNSCRIWCLVSDSWGRCINCLLGTPSLRLGVVRSCTDTTKQLPLLSCTTAATFSWPALIYMVRTIQEKAIKSFNYSVHFSTIIIIIIHFIIIITIIIIIIILVLSLLSFKYHIMFTWPWREISCLTVWPNKRLYCCQECVTKGVDLGSHREPWRQSELGKLGNVGHRPGLRSY